MNKNVNASRCSSGERRPRGCVHQLLHTQIVCKQAAFGGDFHQIKSFSGECVAPETGFGITFHASAS